MSAKHDEHHLHYDMDELVAHYRASFSVFMKSLFVCTVLVLIYFFVFVVYLGARGQTPSEPMVKEFGDRIQYEYKGTKLPMFGGPATPPKAHHGE